MMMMIFPPPRRSRTKQSFRGLPRPSSARRRRASSSRKPKKRSASKANALFAKNAFRDAAKFYGEAIDLDPYDHSLYSNRALCFLNWGAFEKGSTRRRGVHQTQTDFLKGHLRDWQERCVC